jgi:hypothetical protein
VPRCAVVTERDCTTKADPVSPPTFLNFAYGSNMSTRRIRARAPSARPIGIGSLAGHRLAWHKAGRDGSAKCDIMPSSRSGDFVWGVLYEIALHERPLLDEAEGLGRGYDHRIVEVVTDVGSVVAGAYNATHIDRGLRPFDWYLALVLDGALEHGLPAGYVAGIEAVATLIDPNPDRREINLELLRGLPLRERAAALASSSGGPLGVARRRARSVTALDGGEGVFAPHHRACPQIGTAQAVAQQVEVDMTRLVARHDDAAPGVE